jgi:hypothetical protein
LSFPPVILLPAYGLGNAVHGLTDQRGNKNTQFVIFRHFDQPHPHIHIVYNRVDNDGNAIKGDTSFTKSAAITKALTREYGLTFGKGKDKVRRERLKGKDAVKYRLYDAITAALKDCVTWDELRKLLATKGISLDFVRNSDGSIRGVTFTDSKRKLTFAGSKIDRSLSFANIDKHMFRVMQFDDRQDEEPLRLHQELSFDINDAFDFSQNSDKLRHPSKDGTAELNHVNADNYVSFDTSLGINSTIASPSHAIAFLSASLPRPYCASLDGRRCLGWQETVSVPTEGIV